MGAIEGSPLPSEAVLDAIGAAWVNPAGGPGALAPRYDLEQRNYGESFMCRQSRGRYTINKANGRRAGAILYVTQSYEAFLAVRKQKTLLLRSLFCC